MSRCLAAAVEGSDCVTVMVAHDQYRHLDLVRLRELVRTPVLVDGRNVFDKEKAREVGFIYRGVGNL